MVKEFISKAHNRWSNVAAPGAPFQFEVVETPTREPWSAQLNQVDAEISESHGNLKGARPEGDSKNGKFAAGKSTGLRRRAQATTWWIYYEVGDPEARKLLQVATRGGAPKNLVAQRLKRTIPGWTRRDKAKRELAQLLDGQFRLSPEAQQSAIDRIKRQISEHCMDFAIQKYSDSPRTRLFGRRLGKVAFSELGIRELSQARAARAVLDERIRNITKTRNGLKRLTVLLEELGASKKLRIAAMAEARAAAAKLDPIEQVLKRFFMVKDRFGEPYWPRFFDRFGKPRTKKLPGFPEMKKQMVEDLLSPKQRGFPRHPADCEVTRKEAWALTANCLKIAFPTFFSSSFSGESIKSALRYEQHRADLRVVKLQRRGVAGPTGDPRAG